MEYPTDNELAPVIKPARKSLVDAAQKAHDAYALHLANLKHWQERVEGDDRRGYFAELHRLQLGYLAADRALWAEKHANAQAVADDLRIEMESAQAALRTAHEAHYAARRRWELASNQASAASSVVEACVKQAAEINPPQVTGRTNQGLVRA